MRRCPCELSVSTMESSTMYSPPVAESFARWESRDRYYCRYQGHGDDDQGGFRVPEAVSTQFMVGPYSSEEEKRCETSDHLPKVYRRKKGPATEKVQVGACRDDDQVVISPTRVCSDCKTSKTPLWRNGPAGPKSLCNACGIRYRKRGKTGFNVVQMASDVLMEERPRQETPLFLLQRRFAGTEEAKAAEMLMALSCGFPIRS